MTPRGLYWIVCDSDLAPRVHLVDRATGRDQLLGMLEGFDPSWPAMGLGLSPDGASILYAKRVRDGSDLMLIENFR